MKLLLVRHGIALPSGTPGVPDAERALTSRGVKRFRRAAKGLARISPRLGAVLTSPLVRARQTAVILADALGHGEPREEDALVRGRFEAIAAVLAGYPPEAGLALVGHEPWLSELLARLVGGADAERLEFRKGGAALVEIPGPAEQGGRLVWALPPRVLRRLG